MAISPTFYERNCANFLAPIKNLIFTSSTKKLCTKLSYEKAARKMLVKLTLGLHFKSDYYDGEEEGTRDVLHNL
jgi:hypothetical protein